MSLITRDYKKKTFIVELCSKVYFNAVVDLYVIIIQCWVRKVASGCHLCNPLRMSAVCEFVWACGAG